MRTLGRDVPRLDRLPPADPPAAVRLRRGSEGLEIRPVVRPEQSDQEWDHLDDAYASEGDLDADGDRMRAGPRYQTYEREPPSESSGSGSNSDSGGSTY